MLRLSCDYPIARISQCQGWRAAATRTPEGGRGGRERERGVPQSAHQPAPGLASGNREGPEGRRGGEEERRREREETGKREKAETPQGSKQPPHLLDTQGARRRAARGADGEGGGRGLPMVGGGAYPRRTLGPEEVGERGSSSGRRADVRVPRVRPLEGLGGLRWKGGCALGPT